MRDETYVAYLCFEVSVCTEKDCPGLHEAVNLVMEVMAEQED